MRLNAPACGALVCLTALVGCRGSRPATVPRPLTFNKDIAPILFEHCGSCHRPGDASAAPAANAAAGETAMPGRTWCIAGAHSASSITGCSRPRGRGRRHHERTMRRGCLNPGMERSATNAGFVPIRSR
jgi:hypothetical protein